MALPPYQPGPISSEGGISGGPISASANFIKLRPGAISSGPISLTAISAGPLIISFIPTAPSMRFSGLVREILVSGQGVAFSGVVREALAAGVGVKFDGMLREVLSSGNRTNFSSLVREALTGAPNFDDGPIPLFPALPIGFPVKFNPSMDTLVGTTKSLREMRVALRQTPLWDIELLFEELRDQTQNQMPYGPLAGFEQYEQLVQLWLMMYGQTNVFAFDAPWDDSRSDQVIATGDGATYIFTIVRTWGTGATATTAPIGLVNEVFDVSLNGVTVDPSEYYIQRNKIYFVNSATNIPDPPPVGQVLTMTFSYYYLCRFVEDEQSFEEFAKNRWTVPSLKFRAVYWP